MFFHYEVYIVYYNTLLMFNSLKVYFIFLHLSYHWKMLLSRNVPAHSSWKIYCYPVSRDFEILGEYLKYKVRTHY